MKKLTAIFLLLQFLSNNAFAEELLKLPKLFTHYYHHAHHHNDQRNFTDYLLQHYAGSHASDEHQGEDRDCDLPFKHCHNSCVNVHLTVVAFIPSFEETDLVFPLLLKQNYRSGNEKTASVSAPPVWQPPKTA